VEAVDQTPLDRLAVLAVVVPLAPLVVQETRLPPPPCKVMLAALLAMPTPLLAVGVQVRLERLLVGLVLAALVAMAQQIQLPVLQ
jgi:hypothetical protein